MPNGAKEAVSAICQIVPLNFKKELQNDTECFWLGLCPFNADQKKIDVPRPDYDEWLDGKCVREAGKWGFVDTECRVVIPPQYVYIAILKFENVFRAKTAKQCDGGLVWGVIDEDGREIIPCEYEEIYMVDENALAIRKKGESLHGIVNLDGKLLTSRKFYGCYEYDPKHGLLSIMDDAGRMGVYSLAREEFIIPTEYHYIQYWEYIISCERFPSDKPHYDSQGKRHPYWEEYDQYDMKGNRLAFLDEYDSASDKNGMILVEKNGKYGYVTLEGTQIVPCVLSSADREEFKLYQKGYVITRDQSLFGVSTLDGREMLPCKFTYIRIEDVFLIASPIDKGERLSPYADLYDFEGTPILQGIYRNIVFDADTMELTAETPRGVQHFQWIPKKIQKA